MRRLFAPLAALLLCGCITAPRLPGTAVSLPGASVPPAEASVPPPPAPPETTPQGWRIAGAEIAPKAAAPTRVERRGQTLSLTFDNAPIAAVADAVFGQALRRPFRIDPEVQGSITLRIAGFVTETDVVRIVDQALRATGAALTPEGQGYAIVPVAKAAVLTEAPIFGSATARAYTGGIVIYPAQNVSAAELVRLLTPLAGSSAQVRADSQREHIYLTGDVASVNALLRTAQMFDVDWMQAMHFQFTPLRYATPREVTEQLRKLMGGPDGPVGTQVDFIEVERLNGVIVIAKTAKRLDDIQTWIERLDQPSPAPRRRLRSIPLANQNAADFVKVLSGLLGPGGAQATAPATTGATSAPTGQVDGLRITADPRSNAILLIADDAEYESVRRIVTELDVVPAQVLIEATVAEVTLNDQLKYGVQWFFENGSTTGGFGSAASTAAASSYPGFSIRYLGGDFRAVLNALSGVTDVQLVSTPRILVLANETADLQVGDQVPVITQTTTGATNDALTVNTVQYRNTGVVLQVTPRVGDGGVVFIDISQEVSEVTGTTSSDIDSPTIQQRRFSTKIQVEDGQVVALGGLLRNTHSVGDTRVPYLGQLPGVGALFRSRDRTVRQTELVVFLKVTLLRGREDADRMTDDIALRLESLGLRRDAR
jgi:general secretion pathway protein D